MPRRRSITGLLSFVTFGYAALVGALWLIVDLGTDKAWPATLIAFGPRWPAVVPLPILMAAVLLGARVPLRWWLVAILGAVGAIALVGVMDLRLGLGRDAGPPTLRVMTLNLGGANFSAASLNRLMKSEAIDVAALQECPYYDYSPARLGWQFYYAGDFCLVSRFPFSVVDVPDPENAWRRRDEASMRFRIDTPTGPVELLSVHFGTIRSGFEALRDEGLDGLRTFAANRRQARLDSGTARERAQRSESPLIIAGDFNLPVESAIYRADWGSFRNAFSSCGRGFGRTKMTRVHGIRIDHVLMSRHWACTDARVLARPSGGDHAPLVVSITRSAR